VKFSDGTLPDLFTVSSLEECGGQGDFFSSSWSFSLALPRVFPHIRCHDGNAKNRGSAFGNVQSPALAGLQSAFDIAHETNSFIPSGVGRR
jgi:hypothetical protein